MRHVLHFVNQIGETAKYNYENTKWECASVQNHLHRFLYNIAYFFHDSKNLRAGQNTPRPPC